MHKPECPALQKWAKTAPSAALSIPNDAVRCLGRILWRMRSKGLDSGWVSRPELTFPVHPSLICVFSPRKYKRCDTVGVAQSRLHLFRH